MKRLACPFFLLLAILLPWLASPQTAFAIHPDNTEEARRTLQMEREYLKTVQNMSVAQKANRLIQLGLWPEATAELNKIKRLDHDQKIVWANLYFLQHEYHSAERLVANVLKRNSNHHEARLLQARLHIQAWSLPNAAAICQSLLLKAPGDEAAALLLGRIRMLEKNYEEALRWAKEVEERNPANAEAYLLESDVHFWTQKPQLAEAPLIHCLELDPFNADARFNYGYAIWRRVDATQLNAMAAQWEIALEINPLHFVTHWHWGNGHTNLTYADYKSPDDEEVRTKLKPADKLISENRILEAIALAREVEKQYPTSVLPAMLRGSAYYMAFDMNQKVRLDSAQAIFEQILQRKKHYGPAHNGLAAVIKRRGIPYLAAYDSLTALIRQTQITDAVNFAKVFPDVNYYPGDEVQKMVWRQLYTSIVYFPFLAKQNRQFVIPPLHIDLATAMKSPYFRQATTFDNRQWMDIRGVGSGAASLEYVVRGAYLERNVVLHEYVHLFHGIVFSDQENRRVRQLYYQSMKENRTLDYYSANNESEYLAQTYPAYFELVKVHPSDHKSINTTRMLREKDPAMYAFLDSLVQKQRAYLAGNQQAMADNWAEVYVRLSDDARRKGADERKWALSAAYLDTALTWKPDYLPAYLSYVSLKRQAQKYEEAGAWLRKAKEVDSTYAPIYTAAVELSNDLFKEGLITAEGAVKQQATLFSRAMELEKDYDIRAGINRNAREFYASYAMIPQAVKVAEEYVKTTPTVSTYLRDRRDEALAFACFLRGTTAYRQAPLSGYNPLTELARLIGQKPQDYELRAQYAEVLAANEMYKEALQTLSEAQRILSAAGTPRYDYALMMSEYALASRDTMLTRQTLAALPESKNTSFPDQMRWIRMLTATGNVGKAETVMASVSLPKEALALADYSHTWGIIQQMKGALPAARASFEAALKANPYHAASRTNLINLLEKTGNTQEAKAWQEGVRQLF